jgi:thiol-disulfide isomerase/thioredoxin
MILLILLICVLFALYYVISMLFSSNKIRFVLYYTNWCGNCKNFKPIWNEFKNQNTHSNIKIEEVDCDSYFGRSKCAKYSVNKYPTVLLHMPDSNTPLEFNGKRTVQELNKFLDTNLSSKTEHSNTQDKLVLYYTKWCGYSKAIRPEWEKLLKEVKSQNINVKLEEIDCDSKSGTLVCKKNNVSGYPSLLYHKSNNKQIEYNGNRKADNMLEFIKSNMK